LAGAWAYSRADFSAAGETVFKRSPKRQPEVVAFDVIGTLFDLVPLGIRFKDAGLPADALGEWFARMLRDAVALSTSGVYKPFHEVASGTLEIFLTERSVEPSKDRISAILEGFGELPSYPDVEAAFKLLRQANVRIITLTNGGAETTRKLLKRAGVDGMVERIITIDEVRQWKPAREVYRHAAKVMRVEPGQMALVAAHDWDVQGASRAGLVTGWVGRHGKRFHPAMDLPDVKGATLVEVAGGLLALPKA
jgi:2-haloacid dehalogenase